MKILHVVPSPRAEGTPRLVLDWLEIKEVEQDLLFLSSAGELKGDFDAQPNWKAYNTSFEPRMKTILKIIKLVYRICRQQRPDVVIAWMTGFSPWVHIGARLAGVRKLIVHAGNPPGNGFLNKYIYSYMCFWIGDLLGSKVIACSEYIRNEYQHLALLSRNQFYAVYNCFQLAKFQREDISRNSNEAIMVATLEPHKDQATLLHAWKILEDQGYNLHLKLAGDGVLKETLVKLTRQLELKKVDFLGSRKDIPQLLHQSHIFILSTTLQEGFGTVLLEALASGCILIATDVPACREVLRDGKYGILVPAKEPSLLAVEIAKAFSTTLTKKAREEQVDYVQQFTPRNMLRSYLDIVGITI